MGEQNFTIKFITYWLGGDKSIISKEIRDDIGKIEQQTSKKMGFFPI